MQNWRGSRTASELYTEVQRTRSTETRQFGADLGSFAGRWRNGIRSTLKMSSGKPGAGSSPARPTKKESHK